VCLQEESSAENTLTGKRRGRKKGCERESVNPVAQFLSKKKTKRGPKTKGKQKKKNKERNFTKINSKKTMKSGLRADRRKIRQTCQEKEGRTVRESRNWDLVCVELWNRGLVGLEPQCKPPKKKKIPKLEDRREKRVPGKQKTEKG